MNIPYDTVESIRSWPVGADGWHLSPDGRKVVIGTDVRIGSDVQIGTEVKIESSARIDPNVRIGFEVRIGRGVRIANGVWIANDAELLCTEDYLTIGPVGTRCSTLTLHRDKELGVRIIAGCWNGSLDDFVQRLGKNRKHDLYRRIIPQLCEELARRMTRTTKLNQRNSNGT